MFSCACVWNSPVPKLWTPTRVGAAASRYQSCRRINRKKSIIQSMAEVWSVHTLVSCFPVDPFWFLTPTSSNWQNLAVIHSLFLRHIKNHVRFLHNVNLWKQKKSEISGLLDFYKPAATRQAVWGEPVGPTLPNAYQPLLQKIMLVSITGFSSVMWWCGSWTGNKDDHRIHRHHLPHINIQICGKISCNVSR